MPGLWVCDVDSVQKNHDLVERTSSYTEVCLYTFGSSLSDVHAGNLFQNVVNTVKG